MEGEEMNGFLHGFLCFGVGAIMCMTIYIYKEEVKQTELLIEQNEILRELKND